MTRIEGTIGTRLLSIILVDDNETARSALRTLISDYPQVGSVREAANADELFDMLGGTPPDIVLMEVSLPGMDGFEVTERLLKLHLFIKVILLTVHNTEEYGAKANECGALAFISKQDVVEGLEEALNGIFNEVRTT